MKKFINWSVLGSKPQNETKPGRVYLVGAGPGDPDLITHEKAGATSENGSDPIPWDALVKLGGTLVFFDGRGPVTGDGG